MPKLLDGTGMWECNGCLSNGFIDEDEWHQDWCCWVRPDEGCRCENHGQAIPCQLCGTLIGPGGLCINHSPAHDPHLFDGTTGGDDER